MEHSGFVGLKPQPVMNCPSKRAPSLTVSAVVLYKGATHVYAYPRGELT